MIELVFTACLALSPQQCEVRTMTFTEVSPMACAMGAQGVLAKWAGERPGWRIAKWRCDHVTHRSAHI
jgi:predicted ATP-dependent Lon-type protease